MFKYIDWCLFGRKKMLHVVVGIGKDICILVDHCLVSI